MSSTHQKSLFDSAPEKSAWEQDDEADRLFAEVVFDRPIEERFHYEVPYPLRDHLAPGKRVLAPFGRGNDLVVGFCLSLLKHVERSKLKPIREVVDEQTLVSDTMMRLAGWISDTYCCALGQTLSGMIPAGVKSDAGMRELLVAHLPPELVEVAKESRLTTKQRRILRILVDSQDPIPIQHLARAAGCTTAPIHTLERRGLIEVTRKKVSSVAQSDLTTEKEQPLQLNESQQLALASILQASRSGRTATLLLHGVTGSGKTEVYLQAIQETVQTGRQAIVLVPEISLTPQTIRRFRCRFDRVAVLHSHLSDSERNNQWRSIVAGDAQVVIGARSAIYAPTPSLGLIVIDEEHENTFKQETTPRYHARDVARKRAELEQVPLVLGSATPSLESWHLAITGQCQLLSLPERVADRPLPDVKLVDMRTERRDRKRQSALSFPLAQAMNLALRDNGQIILLLNRRGFATHLHCFKCGYVAKCERCDISLVYHRDYRQAVCHFCDLELPPPERCPKCSDAGISYHGAGTERLEQEVRAKFPGKIVRRMDTDTMRRPGSHDKVLEAFRKGEIHILLGTQMIAKGLDFPSVTLVGVIAADTALHLPDFRAAERTFQLLAQVAGRTGRGDRTGRVFVQTFNPDHPAIQAASRHDYHEFLKAELPTRQAFQYPPYGRMVRLIVRSQSDEAAQKFVKILADWLRNVSKDQGFRVLGPAPAPVGKIKHFYRHHIQIQASHECRIQDVIRRSRTEVPVPGKVEIAVDVDPVSML